MKNRLFITALVACASLCGFGADWVYNSTSGTVSDGVWTFKATVDTKAKTIKFDTCWGYPAELSRLDLSKPVTDGGSTAYALTTLGNMFGNHTNYGKTILETTNGMTLAELVLPEKGLTTIGCGCFANLPALTNIVNFLPDSVTTFETGTTFYKVKAKQDLRLLGMTDLSRLNFMESLITSVTFGPNVGNIGPGSNGQGTFAYCPNITNYVFSPYASRSVMTKSTLSLKANTMTTFNLRGVVQIANGGAFSGLPFRKIIFDDVMNDTGNNETFSSCMNFNEVVFRGRPPTKLNICYRAWGQKESDKQYHYYPYTDVTIPTYIRKIYQQDWAPYAENGEISAEGTTFSSEICTATGVTTVRRPLLLLPTEKIASATEFIEKIAADPEGEFELTADIDLTGSGFVTIPEFIGCLDGAGYKITGLGAKPLIGLLGGTVANLTIDGDNGGAVTQFSFGNDSVQGVFCRTNNSGTILRSMVKNYKVTGSGSGCKIGLFAGVAINDATFCGCVTDETCVWKANNSKSGHDSYAGGIVGMIKTFGIPGRAANIYNCTNNATGGFNQECYAGGAVGGIVGNLSGLAYTCRIVDCVNNGPIFSDKKESKMGGIVGGGGAAAGSDWQVFVIGCENKGAISGTANNGGFQLGGFVGSSGLGMIVSNCVNRGNITASSTAGNNYLGGFLGYTGTPSRNVVVRYFNCANYGDVRDVGTSTNGRASGFFGYSTCNRDYGGTGVYFKNCANYGSLVAAMDTDEFCAPGAEDKNDTYTARANRKVENGFAMTRNIEYFNDEHPANKWWFTVANAVTYADTDYSPKAATAALNANAETLGLGAWCKGMLNGKLVPELVIFCQNPYKEGLQIIIR